MKLKNSIQALKVIFDAGIKSKGIDAVREAYRNCEYKESQDNAFWWSIWWSISFDKRQDIIKLSIPESEWVGGYPDYTDAQLLTLLKRAINLDWIRNV